MWNNAEAGAAPDPTVPAITGLLLCIITHTYTQSSACALYSSHTGTHTHDPTCSLASVVTQNLNLSTTQLMLSLLPRWNASCTSCSAALSASATSLMRATASCNTGRHRATTTSRHRAATPPGSISTAHHNAIGAAAVRTGQRVRTASLFAPLSFLCDHWAKFRVLPSAVCLARLLD